MPSFQMVKKGLLASKSVETCSGWQILSFDFPLSKGAKIETNFLKSNQTHKMIPNLKIDYPHCHPYRSPSYQTCMEVNWYD
jgi:hypothetical protein